MFQQPDVSCESVDGRRGVTVDADLAGWAETAGRLDDRLGLGGRLLVAVLGESLATSSTSYWFGYEPQRAGLDAVLTALGEDARSLDELLAVEQGMVGRRLGVLGIEARERWRRHLVKVATEARSSLTLPERTQEHLAAESAWRDAAAAVQRRRVVQLAPDRALRQVRWYPGCPTRTLIGYADPLGLATVQRAVSEHDYSAAEDHALRVAASVPEGPVDPTAWRLSSLRFSLEEEHWPSRVPAELDEVAEHLAARGLGEAVDFVIPGRAPSAMPSSEYIGMRKDEDGAYEVWYLGDWGMHRTFIRTTDFAAAREVFVKESLTLARGRWGNHIGREPGERGRRRWWPRRR